MSLAYHGDFWTWLYQVRRERVEKQKGSEAMPEPEAVKMLTPVHRAGDGRCDICGQDLPGLKTYQIGKLVYVSLFGALVWEAVMEDAPTCRPADRVRISERVGDDVEPAS